MEYESDDEVVEMLKWIVVEDKEALDGASIDAVREYGLNPPPALPC
jgi:hypothetical protein